VHTLLWQSPPEVHPPPAGHAAHVPPPQSTPVSAAFFTPSAQLAGWQMFPVHTPLWQSAAVPQPALDGHAAQLPPQSTSVSDPFATPSLQDGA
jgi:hypothetical protein